MFLIKPLVSRGADLSHVVIVLSAALRDTQKSFQSGAVHSRRSQTIDEEDWAVSIQLVLLTRTSYTQRNSTPCLLFLYKEKMSSYCTGIFCELFVLLAVQLLLYVLSNI